MEKPSSEEVQENSTERSEPNPPNPSTTSTVPKPNSAKPAPTENSQKTIKPSKRCLEKTRIMKRYIERKLHQASTGKTSRGRRTSG